MLISMNLFWQSWLAAAVFIYPIPHMVALRNLILLFGVIALFLERKRERPDGSLACSTLVGWTLGATTAWLVLHSLFIAQIPLNALANLRGDWFLPIVTGLLTWFASARIAQGQAIRAIVIAMSAHLVWMLCWQLWVFATSGAWPGRGTISVPFGNIDHHSTITVFLIALVLAERVAVISFGASAQLLSGRVAWFSLVAALIADMALQARNGTVVVVTMLVVAAGFASWRRPRWVALVAAVLLFAATSVSLDRRWSGFQESLAVAWNADSTYWLTWDPESRPQLPSGAPLEQSAYARASWARQGLLAVGAYPLGIGFGRDGFGRFIEERYGKAGLVSSHSGLLDFAIGAGLPGLALLLATAVLAVRGGIERFRRHADTAGLMLAFLVSAYLLRCLLDGHLSGWRLSLFAFILGSLLPQRRAKIGG
jgi:hypothetical protein